MVKILVVATEYPGYGGSSTNSYAIICYLRHMGYTCYGIFLENKLVNIDPYDIGDVYRFDVSPFFNKNTHQLIQIRKNIDEIMNGIPDLIICKNYLSPLCMKIIYKNIPTIYLVAGLSNAIDVCDKYNICDMVNNITPNYLLPTNADTSAIKNSTITAVNSTLSLNIIKKTYPEFISEGKIFPHVVDTTQYIKFLIDKNINYSSIKQYDILITSSILSRAEKNNKFLISVLDDPYFYDCRKIIIGKDYEQFTCIKNSCVSDLIPHIELMNIMKSCKILLYPSLYDSNPNTVIESIHNTCIPLVSVNVGNHEILPEYSVCKSYDVNEWRTKIIYLMDNYHTIIPQYKINNVSNVLCDLINKYI